MSESLETHKKQKMHRHHMQCIAKCKNSYNYNVKIHYCYTIIVLNYTKIHYCLIHCGNSIQTEVVMKSDKLWYRNSVYFLSLLSLLMTAFAYPLIVTVGQRPSEWEKWAKKTRILHKDIAHLVEQSVRKASKNFTKNSSQHFLRKFLRGVRAESFK